MNDGNTFSGLRTLSPSCRHMVLIGMFISVLGNPASGQLLEQEGISGSLRTDLLQPAEAGARYDLLTNDNPRSVPLAFAMSAVVPGLGQAYNQHWTKAAAFVVVEAALWTGFFVWRNEGRDGERAFESFAHTHWSPARYAEWLSRYTGYPGDPIEVPSGFDFSRPENWDDADWQTVNNFFGRIRAAEAQSRYLATNAMFSHKLENFGEQQYYELIGKYFQYAPGWDDYNGADDPLRIVDGELVNVSPRFHEYGQMHARANDLLRRASRTTAFILVNHFISAVDAAVFSKIHNDRMETSVSMMYDRGGAPTPLAVFRFTF